MGYFRVLEFRTTIQDFCMVFFHDTRLGDGPFTQGFMLTLLTLLGAQG
jgi:hypothetical protein